MTRVTRAGLLALLLALQAMASPASAGEDAAPPKTGGNPEPQVLLPRATRHGGWGAPVVQLSSVRDRGAVFVGGRGGWIVDRRLTVGGGALGLASDVPAPAQAQPAGEELDLEMGYGGGWVEYTFSPLRLLHVSLGTLVGGGSLSLKFHGGGSYDGSSDGFFVAEPTIVAELNLAESVRVNVGAAYRWIEGVELEGLSDSDVSGLSAVLAVKFGKF